MPKALPRNFERALESFGGWMPTIRPKLRSKRKSVTRSRNEAIDPHLICVNAFLRGSPDVCYLPS